MRNAVIAMVAAMVAASAGARDIFLLLGEGNMAGTGWLAEVEQISNVRIEKFDAADKWVEATEPLHFADKKQDGAGLGMAFARYVADREPEVTIGLVPCAVYGSSMSDWLPDGKCYKEAVRRAKIAKRNGVVRGILFHKGETDAPSRWASENFNKWMNTMVTMLRKDLRLKAEEVPFIYGEIPEFPNMGNYAANRRFNKRIASATGSITNSAFARADGLRLKDDRRHFTRESLQTLGIRYAKEYLRLTKGWTLSLRNVYSDHMVFQRDQPIVIAGEAKPGAKVEVAMAGGKSAAATADKDGKWSVELEAMKAGGPYEIAVACGEEKIVLKDVLVGEVWICSGQSNMEMPIWGTLKHYRYSKGEEVIAAAKDDQLRLFNVQYALGPDGPKDYTLGAIGWQPAIGRNAVGPFSASGYFFGCELRKKLGVPVGLIGCNWGGTRIEPWIPEKAFAQMNAGGVYDEILKQISLTKNFEPFNEFGERNMTPAIKDGFIKFTEWQAKFNQGKTNYPKKERGWINWNAPNPLTDFNADSRWNWISQNLKTSEGRGEYWFRWQFLVAEGGDPLENLEDESVQEEVENDGSWTELHDGLKDFRFEADIIKDADRVFWDGRCVGSTDISVPGWDKKSRRYNIGTTTRGKHVLAIKVFDYHGDGGVVNPRLVWKNGGMDLTKTKFGVTTEMTAPEWLKDPCPPSPWGDMPEADAAMRTTVPATLFNAMVAPLGVFRPRGVVWYQGGSNAGEPQNYGALQQVFVKGWREHFRRDDFAFICTQLAGWREQREEKPFTAEEMAKWEPTDQGHLELRRQQTLIRDTPMCECISAVDLGDAEDVHADNKLDVGKRLAAAAGNLCYGGKAKVRGPQVTEAKLADGAVEITFDDELVLKGGKIGGQEFTLTDAFGKRHWAKAEKTGARKVRVAVDASYGGKVKAVDYAWQPYTPTMSLYNDEGFPVTPFKREF